MYNRYIPQPDGSYRRNSVPEQHPRGSQTPGQRPSAPVQRSGNPANSAPFSGLNGFLSQLLPGGFDTGDWIVMLLLLLIAGDSQENRSHALLTLALYFIL